MSSQNSFGKALASAEKSVRDKAVKKLSKYLSHKKDLSDLDLLKLWKGLFYCFWMSDKPLIQQQLSEKLASLILKIPNEIALKYVVAFWKEIRLEWNGVDRLRLDKFYYLFRQMHLNTFKYLEKVQWDINYVMKYIDIFTDGPLSMLDQTVPPSLLYHTCEVFVQELEKAITKPVPTSVFIDVLEPFFDVVGFCSNDILVEKVNEEIFLNIINIYENEDATGEEESNVLKSCDFKAIYERLEKLSGEPLVLKKNLEHIESLIVIFKGLAETQEVLQDEEENEEEEEEQEEIEEEKAAQKEENNDIEIIDKEVKEVEVKPSAKKGRPKGKKAATTPKGKKTNNKKKEEEPKPIEIDDEEEKPKNKNQKKRKAETEAKPIEIDGASKEKNDDEVEVIESSPKKRRKNAPKATATAKKNTKAKGKGAKAKAKEETEPESESVIVINESDDDKKQKQSEPKIRKSRRLNQEKKAAE